MGYRRKVYRLVFDDEQHEGLEVRARGISIDRAVKMLALGASLSGAAGILADTEEGAAQRERLYEGLAAVLLEWNVEEDDGTPVPVTVDGIRTVDWDIVMAIFEAWSTAVMGVGRPLPPSSTGGGTSDEQALSTLPVESLSPSPPSSSPPS